MKFSIITPWLPPRHTITRAVQCVNDQTYQDWEHIVMIDDPYARGTDDLINPVYSDADERRKVIRCTENHGHFGNHCRNDAWNYATGDYIFYLDDDDILYPNCLEVVADKIEKDGTDPNWGYFAILHLGWYFFNYPPRGGLITALQMFHKRVIDGVEIRWADDEEYGNDWFLIEKYLLPHQPLLIDECLGDLPKHNLGEKF